MSITKKQIEEIANLARIKLTEEEKEKYISQLSSVLDYFEQLKEIDTKDIEPLINPNSIIDVLREDKAINCDEEIVENILVQMPEKKGRYLKVKRIL